MKILEKLSRDFQEFNFKFLLDYFMEKNLLIQN